MMPGHEDREDLAQAGRPATRHDAAMMPGHEDREDPTRLRPPRPRERRRNDARSRRPGRRNLPT